MGGLSRSGLRRRFARRRAIGRISASSAAELERNLVWVVGSPRTGTTWLMGLLSMHERVVKVNEPAIGQHLCPLMPDILEVPAANFELDKFSVPDARAEDDDYFFCRRYAHVWEPLLRDLILGRMHAQVRERTSLPDPLVLLKEPNGSQGAGLLLTVLPRSRMVFLVRDGRDVLDSELDAHKPGSWLEPHRRGVELSPQERLRFIENRGLRWVYRMKVVREAYERHAPDRRFLVRYEDLRADTSAWISRLLDWLDLELDQDQLEEKTAAMSFEALPASAKGTGRFVRAAQPGLWRENFSAEEQALANRVMGPTLSALGY